MIDLSWMAWTVPTAIFFTVIALILVTFTILELRWPTV
jgi:predicted small integral membrane protein